MKILSDNALSKTEVDKALNRISMDYVIHSEKINNLVMSLMTHKVLIGSSFLANLIITIVLKYLF